NKHSDEKGSGTAGICFNTGPQVQEFGTVPADRQTGSPVRAILLLAGGGVWRVPVVRGGGSGRKKGLSSINGVRCHYKLAVMDANPASRQLIGDCPSRWSSPVVSRPDQFVSSETDLTISNIITGSFSCGNSRATRQPSR